MLTQTATKYSNYSVCFHFTYISSLHSRLGKDGISQSTILSFLKTVAFLRRTT